MAKITSGPIQLDWEIYCGDRNREIFEITSDDPVDITGCVITAQARVKAPDPTVALTATAELTEPLLGQFSVEWPGEDVRALLAGAEKWVGVFDIQIQEPDETLPKTLLRGAMTAIHDVTREATP